MDDTTFHCRISALYRKGFHPVGYLVKFYFLWFIYRLNPYTLLSDVTIHEFLNDG